MLFLELDRAARQWVVTHRLPFLEDIMWGLSAIGRWGLVWFLLVSALVAARRLSSVHLLQLALVLLVTTMLVDHIVKPLVHRERPFRSIHEIQVIGREPHDASFPSGHAATA